MRPRRGTTRQPGLLDSPAATPAMRLPPEVQEQLREALILWMRAVAATLQAEEGVDDRHHR